MHVIRGRPEIAERHGAGHVARCTARAPHGRPGPTRRPPCQVPAHHAQRAARAVPGRPGQAPLRGVCPGWAVGRRHSPANGAPSYVRAFCGWVYVAFVTDVYSRRIIGWQTTYRPVCTDLALDALQMAVWQRKRTGADLTPGASLATVGCSTGPFATGRPCPTARQSPRWGRRATPFGFALAEALNSLYKAELIRNQGPWEDIDAVEVATAEWVHWAGTIRSHSAIGMRTPAEHEAAWAPDRHRHEQSQPATTGTR